MNILFNKYVAFMFPIMAILGAPLAPMHVNVAYAKIIDLDGSDILAAGRGKCSLKYSGNSGIVKRPNGIVYGNCQGNANCNNLLKACNNEYSSY